MMQGMLQPTFTKLWGGWMLLTGVTLGLPGERWLRWVWAGYFLVVEGLAVAMSNGGLRDTFSETFTWLQRKMEPKSRLFYRNFNAFLFMPVILIVSGVAAQLFSWYLPDALAVVIFGLMVVGLHDHLFNPDQWGATEPPPSDDPR